MVPALVPAKEGTGKAISKAIEVAMKWVIAAAL
jgi:hypothetical protein